jgi:hypothetical protein
LSYRVASNGGSCFAGNAPDPNGSFAVRALVPALGLLVLSAFPAVAQYADDNPKLALARQLVSELITEDRVSQIGDSFMPAIIGQLQARGLKVGPTAAMGIRHVMQGEIRTVIDDTLPDLAKAYAGAFSTDELKTLTAFYGSAVGRKLLVEEPRLMGSFMPDIAARVEADMPALQRKIRTVFASLPSTEQ